MVFGNKNWAVIEELSGGRDIYNKSVRFFRNTSSRPIKAYIFIVASWPGLFFTLSNGVIGRPIV